MTDASVVVQTLRSLGLTRAEAETYLAIVNEGASAPVSAYHVAQAMGKDPANLSKTLGALERVGAVRAIQEKPRLYVPIFPRQFTENLLSSMKEQSRRVLDQFEDLQPALPHGVPMALASMQQALEKAADLLTHCRAELLIFSEVNLLARLGTSLEALAASSEVRVRLLCCESFTMAGVETRVVPMDSSFGTQGSTPWLQLVIDRATWLIASIPSDDAEKSAVGWWCTDPGVASVMGASMAATFQTADESEVVFPGPPVAALEEPAFEEGLPFTDPSENIEEETEVTEEPTEGESTLEETVEKVASASEEMAPEKEQPPNEEDDDDEGFTFLIQHDEEDDPKL